MEIRKKYDVQKAVWNLQQFLPRPPVYYPAFNSRVVQRVLWEALRKNPLQFYHTLMASEDLSDANQTVDPEVRAYVHSLVSAVCNAFPESRIR